MTEPRTIVLVGPMGAGKSAAGQALAGRLRRAFVDADAAIEQREDRSIPEIFQADGEDGFRRVERETVCELLGRTSQGVVLALGGGAFLDTIVRQRCSAPDTVTVYLHASPETSLTRVGENPAGDRPMLRGDAAARLSELYEFRDPVYRECDLVVDTDGRTVTQVVEEIVGQL